VSWKTEFDGKLCQKYSYQKLLKFDNCFQVTVKNVGDVFLRHSALKEVKC